MPFLSVSAKPLVVLTCTVLMESSHKKTLNAERLHLLCTVGGGRSEKVKESCAKSYALVTSEMQTFHSINILEKRPDTHSGTVCSKCYSRLMALKHSAVQQVNGIEAFSGPFISHAR